LRVCSRRVCFVRELLVQNNEEAEGFLYLVKSLSGRCNVVIDETVSTVWTQDDLKKNCYVTQVFPIISVSKQHLRRLYEAMSGNGRWSSPR